MDAVCPLCHAVQVPHARFCHLCGATQPPVAETVAPAPPPPIVCAACGHQSPGQARICLRCGERLEPGATAPPRAPARAAARAATVLPMASAGFPFAGLVGLLLAATAAGIGWYWLKQPAESRAVAALAASPPASVHSEVPELSGASGVK